MTYAQRHYEIFSLKKTDFVGKKGFTKNESTITFDLEVELKQNFQDLSFMTFQINLYSQILEKFDF